jgi:hypothetical protein
MSVVPNVVDVVDSRVISHEQKSSLGRWEEWNLKFEAKQKSLR